MIKNKRVISGYYAPYEEWMEVYYAFCVKGYKINANFANMLNRKAPTFWNTHKPLASATIKQLKECVSDQE